MTTTPGQYATDRNLRARQRLWQHQEPPFDVVRWTLELAGVTAGMRVLDVGCGNGRYLAAMSSFGVRATGCDLSLGMLQAVTSAPVVAADAVGLPYRSGAFDVVLAPQMLYHVADREAAAYELSRVLAPGGTCVAVANGAGHLASLRVVIDAAAQPSLPGWRWGDPLGQRFSLENGVSQLSVAFDDVRCVRPDHPGRAVTNWPTRGIGWSRAFASRRRRSSSVRAPSSSKATSARSSAGSVPTSGGAREARPLAVVISGAPGSGKTTLALKLSDAMGLPHLNKDLVCASLLRGGLPAELANKRAFELTYLTARRWLQGGLSLVMDMTMYAAYSPGEVESLQPHGVVVNVHTRCQAALVRWEAKMLRDAGPGMQQHVARIRRIHRELAQPLNFGCPRLDVATDSGYEPDLATIVNRIEAAFKAVSA